MTKFKYLFEKSDNITFEEFKSRAIKVLNKVDTYSDLDFLKIQHANAFEDDGEFWIEVQTVFTGNGIWGLSDGSEQEREQDDASRKYKDDILNALKKEFKKEKSYVIIKVNAAKSASHGRSFWEA